jgi:drug/metabolite transporter (DMT)-like permease
MPRSLYIALLLLSLIWGGSFYFIKILLHDFGPWTIAFLRSSFGIITITVIMILLKKPFELRRIPWVRMAVMASVNTSIPWTLIAFSETRVTSGMASVLNATTPIWTMIVGMAFFRATTSRMQWLGMGTAFIGLLILLGVNPKSFISIDGLGFVCMMAATVCYAMGSQLSKRLSNGLSMYQITFGTLLCAAAGSGIVAFSSERVPLSKLAMSSNFGTLIGIGVFGSGIAYVLYYYMVQRGTPEFASMVTYLVPATAIIWGYTLLREELHWSLLTGLAFILLGVFIAGRKRKVQTAGSK